MAEFSYARKKFNPNDISTLLDAIKRSGEDYDFDSGWIATPADKIVKHDLGVVPRLVVVQKSSASEGSGHAPDTYTSATTESITITGPLAYCRVLVNK